MNTDFSLYDYIPEICIVTLYDKIVYCNQKVNKLGFLPNELIDNNISLFLTIISKHKAILNHNNGIKNEIYYSKNEIKITNLYYNLFIYIVFNKSFKETFEFETLLKYNKDIIIGKASLQDGKLLYLSDSITNILGYSSDELTGKIGYSIIHSDDIIKTEKIANDILKNNDINTIVRYRKKHKDELKGYIWLEAKIISIDNNIILFTERDIMNEILIENKIKNQEEILLKTQLEKEMEHKLNISKREFMQFVFHESRGWMNAITLSIENVLKYAKTHNINDIHEQLLDMRNANNNITKIFNDTLTLQKIESGEFTYDLEPFSIKRLVSTCKEAIKYDLQEKNIKLIIKIDDVYFTNYLLGDIYRLSQSLRNYLSNAIKFSKYGSEIKLFIKCVEKTENEYLTKIEVIDYGTGIRDEDKYKIFRQFQQIRAGELQNGGGSGLGLSLVKQFIENGHKGQVGFSSKINEGSQFYMIIRFKIVNKDTKIFINRSDLNCNNFIYEEGIFNKDILLVEDQILIIKITSKFFENNNITFDIAMNGQEAIDKIKNGYTYKVIMMDKEMPIKDGYIATKEIRNLGYKYPIIGLTGNALNEQQADFISQGANYILSKPLNLKKFNLIRSYFSF